MSDEPRTVYTCRFCRATFQKEKDLETHYNVIHSQTYGSNEPGRIPRFKSGSRKHRS